jgi:hypothetical protein
MTPLIREALSIGDAAWPPSYYTLLGLTPEEATPERVEAAVLERMERLRAYQLAQPESVTEAMHLLARALDALTDLAAKQHDDAISPQPSASDSSPVAPAYAVVPLPAPQPSGTLILPDDRRNVPDNDPLARRRVGELVRARRSLAAWDGLGHFLAEPSHTPPTRLALVVVLMNLREVAAFEPNELSEDEPGSAVMTLARSNLTTQGLLDLPETRREILAGDWRAGRWRLLGAYERARAVVGRHAQRHRLRRELRRWSRQAPEAAAIALGLVALLIAVYRWLA